MLPPGRRRTASTAAFRAWTAQSRCRSSRNDRPEQAMCGRQADHHTICSESGSQVSSTPCRCIEKIGYVIFCERGHKPRPYCGPSLDQTVACEEIFDSIGILF